MKKVTKRFLSVVLALMTLLSVATFTASASTNGVSQNQAVEWIKARGNEKWWSDVDGGWGCQCVDLVQAYYQYLGYSRMKGSAYEYKSGHLPSGSNWCYSSTPVPGCIFVKDIDNYSNTGHVGLVYAVSGSTIYTVETNTKSPYDGGRNTAYAVFSSHSVGYACTYICPDFPTHSCSFNQKNTDSKYLASNATCTSPATYYYSCTCGAKGSSTFSSGNALGHSYTETLVPATCTKDAYISCKCSRCGNTTTKAAEITYKYSDWSTTKPVATGNSTIETQTQYRYKGVATREVTSPINESGWTLKETKWKQTGSGTYCYFPKPNGFKSSENMGYAGLPISGYENSTSKRVVSGAQHNSYIYWHWVSPMCYGVCGNCFIGEYETDYINAYLGYTTVWEAFESATDLRWYTNSDGTVRVSDHSKYSYNWHISESYRQTYTDYQKVYVYTSTGDWTVWSSEKAPSTTTEVQTRIVYRLKTPTNDVKALGHNWGTPVVTKPATATNTGTETVKCTRCGATETHIIPKITAKITGVTVSDVSLKWRKIAALNCKIETEGKINYTVTYESSNPKAVTVDENGNVYGADSGSSTITCTATDEFGNSALDTCTVTVKLTFIQWIIKLLLPFIA